MTENKGIRPLKSIGMQFRASNRASNLTGILELSFRNDIYGFLVADLSEVCLLCPVIKSVTLQHPTMTTLLAMSYPIFKKRFWRISVFGRVGFEFNRKRDRRTYEFNGNNLETAAYLNELTSIFDRGRMMIAGGGLEIGFKRFSLSGHYVKNINESYTRSFRTRNHEYVNRSDWKQVSVRLNYAIPLLKRAKNRREQDAGSWQ